jgi:hypothetical protein
MEWRKQERMVGIVLWQSEIAYSQSFADYICDQTIDPADLLRLGFVSVLFRT